MANLVYEMDEVSRITADAIGVPGIGTRIVPNGPEEEGTTEDKDVDPAQDFHTMLQIVLKSYVDLQNRGFYWDLRYKNKVYKDIEFVMFMPFIRCDTEEGDKLCGKFLTRTQRIAQLCWYCKCPNEDTHNPKSDFPFKSQSRIQ